MLFEIGSYERALSDFTRVLALRPEEPVVPFNRGRVLFHLGRYEEALADYDRAQAFGDSTWSLFNNRGYTLHMLGRFDAALDDFNQALLVEPGNARTLANRGLSLTRLGRDEDAVADFNRVQDFWPGDLDTLRYRGLCLARLDRRYEALADLGAVLELQPHDHEILWIRGVILARLERFEDALADLDQVLLLRPNESAESAAIAIFTINVLRSKAEKARRSHQLETAVTCYDGVIQRFAEWPQKEVEDWVADAKLDKTKLLRRLGKSEQALAVLDEFLNRYGSGRLWRLVLRSWRMQAAFLWWKLRKHVSALKLTLGKLRWGPKPREH